MSMQEKEILDIFGKTGALLKGHFVLSSGLHSGEYLQCARVLEYPAYAEKLCNNLAGYFKKDRPTCVVAPALGGVIVSYETARALGVRSLFTERKDGKMILRRGFDMAPEDNVVVVEDVITTGLSTREVMEVVKSKGANVTGIGCIVDRSRKKIDFGVKFVNMIKLDLPVFPAEECPLCKKDLEITRPGSR